MAALETAGIYFDRLVGVFSPVRQAKNSIVREIMQKERQYAAAKEDRLTGAWRPISKDVNDLFVATLLRCILVHHPENVGKDECFGRGSWLN